MGWQHWYSTYRVYYYTHACYAEQKTAFRKTKSKVVPKTIRLQRLYYTSAKIIQLNEWRCRDGIHHAKNRGNKVIPLAILSRILAQSCVTPPYIIKAKGLRMIVLVSLIVLLRGLPCFHDFSHGGSHPTSPLNDFCTYFCVNAATRMRTCVGYVSLVKWRRYLRQLEFTVVVVTSYPALIL